MVDSNPFGLVSPVTICTFIDRMVVWLKAPLPRVDFLRLQTLCGKPVRARWKPARFDRTYRIRLELSQPSRRAIELLSLQSNHLNYVEFSLDWNFATDIQASEAYALVDKHVFKQYRRKYELRYFKGTRYTDPRSSATNLVIYTDKPCKLTGEIHCVHFDWRLNGIASLRRTGIFSVQNLLDFDYTKFWAKRLLFCKLDYDRFGRKYWNWKKTSKRRQPWIILTKSGFTYNCDRRAAQTIFRALSVQEICDQYRMLQVGNYLIKLDTANLLPSRKGN